MRRRTLLRFLMALPGLRLWSQAAFPGPHGEALRQLAGVVLPASLGRARANQIADRFVAWVADYKPGAEMDHGYGVTRLRSKPDSPAQTYLDQLAALGTEINHARVEAALLEAKIDALPPSPNGRHVIADLMSFFFCSSEANDLCYRSLIGREDCLGLRGSENPPPPLPKDA